MEYIEYFTNEIMENLHREGIYLSDLQVRKLCALFEAHGIDAVDVQTIRNWYSKMDDYLVAFNVDSEHMLGIYAVYELRLINLPEDASAYFSYEMYAVDLLADGIGYFTDYGFVFENEYFRYKRIK